MFDYSKLAYQLKREIKNFSVKVTQNLSRPKYKFIFQMLYGLLESQSTHLSKMARALKEDISLKKTIERLSRNLSEFTENEILMENYIRISSLGNIRTYKRHKNANARLHTCLFINSERFYKRRQ